MKAANDAASAASSTTNGYLTSIVPTSYIDSMPHSTQSAFNHVTTTDQSGLQRRLSDIGGLKSIKAKQKNRPPKLGLGGLPGAGGGDQNKKMMHQFSWYASLIQLDHGTSCIARKDSYFI